MTFQFEPEIKCFDCRFLCCSDLKIWLDKYSPLFTFYKIYIENDFKTRYNNHKLSFNDRKHSHDTVLSRRIWELKDTDTSYNLKWRIIKRANAYNGNPSRCNLCLSEKLCILNTQDVSLLNKKSELVTKCRHENKFFATNHRKRRVNHH